MAVLEGLRILHDFQKARIILMAPHQSATKPDRRWNYATWSSSDHFPVFVVNRTSFTNLSWNILVRWLKHRSCYPYIRRSGSTSRASMNFTAAHFRKHQFKSKTLKANIPSQLDPDAALRYPSMHEQ